MSNPKELLFVVNQDNFPVEPVPRDEVIKKHLWRRAAGAIIIDVETKQVLTQQRSTNKDERPGKWNIMFGGKVHAGEHELYAAAREVYEEIGVSYDIHRFSFIRCYKVVERFQFEYLHFVKENSITMKCICDPEEIQAVAWRSVGECIDLLSNSAEWYSYGYEIQLLQNFITNRLYIENK